MHIALFGFVVNAVEHLCIPGGTEGGDGQHLGLAAGEHTGAMHAGQQSHLRRKGTDLIDCAAVHALAVIEQPAPHHVFLQLIQAVVEFRDFFRILFVEARMHLFVHRAQPLVADTLVVGIQRRAHLLDREILHRLEHRRIGIIRGKRHLFLTDFRLNAADELHDLLVGGMAGHDTVEHRVVVHLVGTRFDHRHEIRGRRHGDMHIRALFLLGGRVDDIFAVHQTHNDAGNRAVPRNLGDRNGDGRANHRGDFRRTVGIHRHHGAHQRHVVAHILRKQRTDRAVDDP